MRKLFKKRFLRSERGRMTDRNRELVPDEWSLVREGALTTVLCSEGWYSEHSGVCRKAELDLTCHVFLTVYSSPMDWTEQLNN